jgi:hypothetical protein
MKTTILIALTALTATTAFAGDNHNHEAAVEPAPHGGVLRDAPPYKAELVLNKDEAKIYVYSKAGEKLEPAKLELDKLEGKVQFPKDKKAKPVTFTKKGDSFDATIAGVSKVHRYDLHVDLPTKDKKLLIDFGVDNIH